MNTGSNKLKRFAIIFIGILLVAFVAVNVFAYQHAYAMMNFSDQGVRAIKLEDMSLGQKLEALLLGVNPSRPSADIAPAALGEHCASVRIAEPGSPSIGAWHCAVDDNQRLVVLFHGYLMSKSSLMAEARAFMQAGFSVLLVDFRGSWESSEAYTTIGYLEADDVAVVLRYARQHFAPEKVVLYGQSMGAVAVLRAIHSHAIKVDVVIVEAVFDRLLNTIKNRFDVLGVPSFPAAHILVFWGGVQAGFNGFSHNPADYAQAVSMPILFLHGEQDNRATLQDAYHVFEAVQAPKHFSVFPDTVHESHLARHPEKWKSEVTQFLSDHQI